MADPFSSWGAEESGARIGELDNQRSIASALSATQALGNIAMQPAEKRLKEAQASKEELANKQQQIFLKRMQDRAAAVASQPGSPTNPVNQLYDLASQAGEIASDSFAAGLVTQGGNALRASALARLDSARIDTAQTVQRLNGLKSAKAETELTGSLMGPVNDQASWDRANALYTFQTGKPSAYAGLPYSAELVNHIKNSAIEAGKQVELRLREEENSSRDRNRSSADALRKVREEAIRSAAAIAREREDRLAKNGGKPVTKTPAEDTALANKLLEKEYPSLVGANSEAALTIAGEAQILLRRNPALSRPQAIQQAYNEAKARGDFETEKAMVPWANDKVKYNRKEEGIGKTPDKPATVPQDPKALVSGQYYTNGKGQTAQWTGSGFKIVGNARPLSNNNTRSNGAVAAPLNNDTDEHDDDEDD